MLMQPDSLVGKRAFFATKHLFVTPHEDGQLFPSGDHVVQSEDCLGLKQWTKEVRQSWGFRHGWVGAWLGLGLRKRGF
jgi:primary-amine oxidase